MLTHTTLNPGLVYELRDQCDDAQTTSRGDGITGKPRKPRVS